MLLLKTQIHKNYSLFLVSNIINILSISLIYFIELYQSVHIFEADAKKKLIVILLFNIIEYNYSKN